MKRMLTLVLALALMLSCSFIFSSVVNADYELYGEYNLLDVKSATFEGGLGNWIKAPGTDFTCGLSIAKGKGIDESDAMLMSERKLAWLGDFMDVSPIILANGVGEYSFSCYVKVSPTTEYESEGVIRQCFRDDEVVEGQTYGNYGYDASENVPIVEDEYTLVESIMDVIDVDTKSKEYTVSLNMPGGDPSFEGLDEYTIKGALYMTFDIGVGDLLIDNVCVVNLDKLPEPTVAPTATPTEVPAVTATPTATPAIVATTAAIVATTPPAIDPKGNTTLVVVLISAGVLLAGGAAAFLLTKSKKNGGTPDDTGKGE